MTGVTLNTMDLSVKVLAAIDSIQSIMSYLRFGSSRKGVLKVMGSSVPPERVMVASSVSSSDSRVAESQIASLTAVVVEPVVATDCSLRVESVPYASG